MQKQNFLEILQTGKRLLSDGSTGTELQRRGLPTGEPPEKLNLTDPEMVRRLNRDYYQAGSDLVETNTFGANRARLAHFGLQNQVAEICQKAAEIARSVCPKNQDKFVAGSMGPTGEIMEPLGNLTRQNAYEMFAEQARALQQGGVDLLIVETMMSIDEAEVAVTAARESTHLPVIATMTFEKRPAGLRTSWGVDIATAVARLTAAGASVLGANCGKGFEEMADIIREMRPLTRLPLIAQPNAGLPEWVDGVAVYPETPEKIVPFAKKLLQLGANILGGCCGTGPEHIKMIRTLVDQFNQGRRST